MIRKIPFITIKTKQTRWEFPSRLFLLVVFFLSLSLYANDVENTQLIVSSDTIFISEGTIIYVNEVNDEDDSVEIEESAEKIANKPETVSDQMAKHEAIESQKAKKIQQQVNARVQFTFVSVEDLQMRSLHHWRNKNGSLATTVNLTTSSGSLGDSGYFTHFIQRTAEKDQLDLSLSYFQFDKNRNAPLRAPPDLFS